MLLSEGKIVETPELFCPICYLTLFFDKKGVFEVFTRNADLQEKAPQSRRATVGQRVCGFFLGGRT